MKMKVVSAYRMPGFRNAPDLENISGNSFDSIARKLTEGDCVTVEVAGKGYKQLSIKDGRVMVQRNYVYEY